MDKSHNRMWQEETRDLLYETKRFSIRNKQFGKNNHSQTPTFRFVSLLISIECMSDYDYRAPETIPQTYHHPTNFAQLPDRTGRFNERRDTKFAFRAHRWICNGQFNRSVQLRHWPGPREVLFHKEWPTREHNEEVRVIEPAEPKRHATRHNRTMIDHRQQWRRKYRMNIEQCGWKNRAQKDGSGDSGSSVKSGGWLRKSRITSAVWDFHVSW